MDHGAELSDWMHFDLILGLGQDLLPVVSNPNAVISVNSKIKEVGKTPSRYDLKGDAVGIVKWTEKQATSGEIAAWSANRDYGICLQTRYARALDIDVPDQALSDAILAAFVREVGLDLLVDILPVRSRSNSGKQLLLFALPGSFGKRKFNVEGGIVEFLGNGQQCIVAGTHTSGVRYEWLGGLPLDVTEISLELFERAWANLVATFATGGAVAGKVGQSVNRPTGATINDDMVPFLQAEGWVRHIESDGRVHIRCPFESEHSGDPAEASETATTYFPAGVGGFQQGHFRCLHAHCEGRSDDEYLDSLGYIASKFTDETDNDLIYGAPEALLPRFKRDGKGVIEATLTNIEAALRSAKTAGWRIAYDTFKDEVMMATSKGSIDKVQWRPMTDGDYTRLRLKLEAIGFKPVGRELMRDAVTYIAEEITIDTAQVWLGSLRWDGVPRVEKFMHNYFGTEDTDYAKEIGRYLWSALAGRIIEPGCKADMMPILYGAQGIRKSSGIAAMAPRVDCFCELSFSEITHDNIARKMRGMLVAEFAEMDGLHGREIESTKKFVTRTHEQWVPKFKEFTTTFARRLVFIGSTNGDELLEDVTGNRRWLPIEVGKRGDVEVDAIRRDAEQLWAEGAILFSLNGVHYDGAERLAVAEHDAFKVSDVWDDIISAWLKLQFDNLESGQPEGFTLDSVLHGALGIPSRDMTKAHQMRGSKSMRKLGYSKHRRFIHGRQAVLWIKTA